MIWEMNEEYMKKRKKYGVLFINIMHRVVLLDMRFLYHAWNMNMDRPRYWFGWMTRQTSRYYTRNTQRLKPPSTRWAILYAKKILSLLNRVGIIIMWWVGNEDDLFGDNTKTPHKSRGPFNSRQYGAHVEPLTEWIYTWNAKYKSPPKYKARYNTQYICMVRHRQSQLENTTLACVGWSIVIVARVDSR